MTKHFPILLVLLLVLVLDARATSVFFPVSEMTGSTNDVTINVKAVNNPMIYNGSFYYLPKQGTNLTTSGGYVTNSFVPGRYTVTISGLQKSWNMYVTNSASVVSAVDLSSAITIYSGIMALTGRSIQVTNDGLGNYTITDTNTSGGGGTNYGNDTGLPGVVNGSNIGTNLATLATDAELLAATNSIYTAANTYADAAKLAATNKLNSDIPTVLNFPLTNNDTRSLTITNLYWKTNSGQSFFGGTFGFTVDGEQNIGSPSGASGFGRPKHLYVAEDIYGLNHYGAGGGLTYTASSFNGNLATTVNTLQELADAVDDLALGAGGAASNAVTTIGTNSVNLSTAATNLNFVAGPNISLVGSSNQNGTIKILVSASNIVDSSAAPGGDLGGTYASPTIAANAVALGTDTTGNYVATIADSGASEVTVSGSGSETAAVTLAIASGITRDTEIDTIAEVEAIWGRKVTTNNATLPATSLMIGDGARGIAPTTTGSGVLTALANTAGGASGFLLYDAELAALGGLTSAADKIPYFTGSGTAGLVTIGSGLTFSGGTLSSTGGGSTNITDSGAYTITINSNVVVNGDATFYGSTSFSNLWSTNFFIPGQSNGIAAIQSDGSVKATNTPVVTSVDLGLATDTTLTRSSAGNLAVEGNVVYRAGGTDIAVADGGTGLSSGTSGGILGYTASGTLASSAALAANAIVVGGGAGATPTAVSEWTVTATSMTTPAGSATLTMGNKAGDNLLLQGELYGKGVGLTNIPIVTSVTIPMGAFSTNNVTVTDKTPASAVTATNSGDTFYFTDAITNVVHGRFALPYDWNAGVVRVGLRAFCTGTNSLSLTNTVWFVRAAAIGNGDRPDNPTWGTAVYMTNGLTTNSWTSREGITGDVTVGNTPTTAKSILWQIGRAGAASGDTLTNSSVALEEVRIYLQRNTQTSFPTATP